VPLPAIEPIESVQFEEAWETEMTDEQPEPEKPPILNVSNFDKAGHAADGSKVVLALEIDGKRHLVTLTPDLADKIAGGLLTQSAIAEKILNKGKPITAGDGL
jgi:undecaprenyl pyrophosphate synthase